MTPSNNAQTAALPAIRSDISPTLHPNSVEPLRAILAPEQGSASTAPAYAAATGALSTLYESMGDIEDAERAMRQQYPGGSAVDGSKIKLVIQPEKAAQLAADMGAKADSVSRNFDAHLARVRDAISSVDSKIESALLPTQRDALAATAASDIRNYIRSLPDNKRMDFIHSAIENGDHEIASALLSTTPWISGLNREQLANVRDWARQKFSPVEYAQLAALNRLSAHLHSSAQIWITRYKALLPPVKENPSVAASAKLRAS